MSFVVAIVGRANVGKSTLFNRIVGEQRSLVHNVAGVTRDRLYSSAEWSVDGKIVDFTLVDTGGLELGKRESLRNYVTRQVDAAIDQADCIITVVDGRAGLLPEDEELIRRLRRSEKKLFLCVNKVDLNLHEDFLLPFHKLGITPIFPISAQHNRGIDELMTAVLADYMSLYRESDAEIHKDLTRIAIVGRPNVGKSRLLNYLCGEERAVVSPQPGTTRDPIDTRISHQGQEYLLIDTAGIRRQAKIDETLEYLAVLRSMRAVGRSHIAILVVDATEGITHQEMRLVSQILQRGRGLICFYNKCDLLEGPAPSGVKHFPYVSTCHGAAKLGQGMEALFPLVKKVMRSYKKKVTTAKLNEMMAKITAQTPPPQAGGRPLKIRYATQTGCSPPTFQIFVNHLERLTNNYKKYLENSLYKQLKLVGVPIKLEFREGNRD